MSTTLLFEAIRSLNAPDALQLRLNMTQLGVLAAFLQRHALRAGDQLIAYRDMDRTVFLVESGTLQVYVPSAPGDATRGRVAILRAGAVVGEPGIFGETPRMAQVDAMSAAVVWALTRPRFEEMAARQPDLALEFLRACGAVMAERMRTNLDRGLPVA